VKTASIKHDKWYIECIPDDGARISLLRYAGYDLLTTAPVDFKAPAADYGEYEKRPVYGYDDCFPSVDACIHPTGNYQIRDHGQLCWLKWNVISEADKLICSTECKNPNISFTRILKPGKDEINWKYNILNNSDKVLEFLLVVHPLMPLQEITRIQVPGFRSVSREGQPGKLNICTPSELNVHLLSISKSKFEMLYIEEVKEGRILLGFKNRINLVIEYDFTQFPTIGIWWNNSGYPDEPGRRRSECAFEPISGINSNLAQTYRTGRYLNVGAHDTFEWNIYWKIG